MTKEDNMNIYEIRYEDEKCSGTQMVRAASRGEALLEFTTRWRQYGDPCPTCWIVGAWATEN